MKKIFAIFTIAMMALMFNSCGTALKGIPQSGNKLNSPFPEVKTQDITFVENYVTYSVNASYIERVGKQRELMTDLRGELANAIYASVSTDEESTTVRTENDDEYEKSFRSTTRTKSSMSFPNDMVYTITEEIRKGDTIYFWVRLSADKQKMTNYYEKNFANNR